MQNVQHWEIKKNPVSKLGHSLTKYDTLDDLKKANYHEIELTYKCNSGGVVKCYLYAGTATIDAYINSNSKYTIKRELTWNYISSYSFSLSIDSGESGKPIAVYQGSSTYDNNNGCSTHAHGTSDWGFKKIVTVSCPENSILDRNEEKCYCNSGYTEDGDVCTKVSDYCLKYFGEHSSWYYDYSSGKEGCKCNDGYDHFELPTGECVTYVEYCKKWSQEEYERGWTDSIETSYYKKGELYNECVYCNAGEHWNLDKQECETCRANSQWNEQIQYCQCLTDYMDYNKQCITKTEWCKATEGDEYYWDTSYKACRLSPQNCPQNSEWNAEQQGCVCYKGYKVYENQCVSANDYCVYTEGEGWFYVTDHCEKSCSSNSHFDQSSKDCVCNSDAVLYQNQCMTYDQFCKAFRGDDWYADNRECLKNCGNEATWSVHSGQCICNDNSKFYVNVIV